MALRITAAALVGLTLVIGLLIVGRANALTGTIAGHSFALGGSVGSVTLGPLNLVTLPPGGSSSVPLGASEPPVAANSTSASTSCSGNSTGPQVDATCFAEVNGLSLSVSTVEIVTATVIRAQSNSVDAGAGPSSNNVGTLFSGLCIRQAPIGPCTPISAPGPVSINLPGVVTGTIDVQVEVPRTMEGAVAGSGLTVTMLHIELTTPLISIIMDIAEADSFVGGVTADTPTPTPSATPTPTGTPTPTPSDTPTPTASPSPTPSDTPTPTTSPSPTPSDTPTPTASPSPTPIPSATPTPTGTPTPTPSDSPTPTASPSPSEPPSPSPTSTLGLTTTPSPPASPTPGATSPPSATPAASPTPIPTRPAAPPAKLPPGGAQPPEDPAAGGALYLAFGLAAALASALHLRAHTTPDRRPR